MKVEKQGKSDTGPLEAVLYLRPTKKIFRETSMGKEGGFGGMIITKCFQNHRVKLWGIWSPWTL